MQIFPGGSTKESSYRKFTKREKEGSMPYKFIGVDFAGPIKYHSKTKKEVKAHIMLSPNVYTWLCCRTKVLRNSCTV